MNKERKGKNLLKLMSLVMAGTLWFYVLNSEPLEVERKIELVLIPPKGKALNVDIPKVVSVKLKGSRAFVKNLFFDKERLYLDLKNYPYEQETFPVTFDSSMVPAPFGVEVLEINPPQVTLSVEKEIRKFVPIRPKIVSEVPKDLKLVKKDFNPKELMIRGPRSVLKKIGSLSTLPIDLALLEGEGSLKVPLELSDGRVIVEKLEDVTFNYTIRPNKANLTIDKVKIRFLTSRGRFQSPVKSADLKILVSDEQGGSFEQSDFQVIAVLPEDKKGKFRVKLEARLPEGVHLLQIDPEYINVSVR